MATLNVPFKLSHPRRDEALTAEEHALLESRHRERLAADLGISLEMVSYAVGQNWDVEEYAALANARNIDQWNRGRESLATKRETRAEAARQLDVEQAKRTLRSST